MVSASRQRRLNEEIVELGSVAVAFSGGVDSTLLLAASLRAVGPERVVAITADTPVLPRRELRDAVDLAAELGTRHVVARSAGLGDEHFTSNPSNRCYFCKKDLFATMRTVADREGYAHLVYGATVEDAADDSDYRSGMAAANEAGFLAPLRSVGLRRRDVRDLSRAWGLRTWDKPAMDCLALRFPYGTAITSEDLVRVEQGEAFLRTEFGFHQARAMHHGPEVRIEVALGDLARLAEEPVRQRVHAFFRDLGYITVMLDLAGFRSGNIHEILPAGTTTAHGTEAG